MELIEKNIYNGLDVYRENALEFYTRQQVGEALGYKNPSRAVGLIHDRHKEEFKNKYSVFTVNTERGERKTFMYNSFGVIRICAFSSQLRAKELLFIITDRMQRTIAAQQAKNAKLRAEIDRQKSNSAGLHAHNKQLKAENKKLALIAGLQATEEGRIAQTMHDAIKTAICAENYQLNRIGSRERTYRQIVGVYDREFLYMPLETLTELYNKYSPEEKTTLDLVIALRKSGFIEKNNNAKLPNKTINGDKKTCQKISVEYVEDIISIEPR